MTPHITEPWGRYILEALGLLLCMIGVPALIILLAVAFGVPI